MKAVAVQSSINELLVAITVYANEEYRDQIYQFWVDSRNDNVALLRSLKITHVNANSDVLALLNWRNKP